jgi:hypothetical protein
MKNNLISLEVPTNDLVNKYIDLFKNDERYFIADKAISNLVKSYPNNKLIENILLKISVINDLYSTNIFSTFSMAKHIQKIDIDDELSEGSPDIVHRIATGHGIKTKKNNKEINFYSFATKYCNWHNSEDYAIYDKFVENLILEYRDKYNFSSFCESDLRIYGKFKNIIKEFSIFFNLSNHNLKEIDKFLWIYGKRRYAIL